MCYYATMYVAVVDVPLVTGRKWKNIIEKHCKSLLQVTMCGCSLAVS